MKIISVILFSILFIMEQSNAQQSIKFEEDKVYELVLFSVNEGKFDQLVNEYLPKVLPLVGKYGGRPIASFSVISLSGVEDSPQVLAIWEWPSADSFYEASNDEAIQVLLPIRNEAMAWIEEANFFSVDKTTTILLNNEDNYMLLADSKLKANQATLLVEFGKGENSQNKLKWENMILIKEAEEKIDSEARAKFSLKAIIQ